MLTKQQKIDKIYQVIGGMYMGLDGLNNPIYKCMIGDVLDWIEKTIGYSGQEYNEDLTGVVKDAIRKRGPMRKPIEEQSDDAISFIYDLILWNK